LLLFGCKEEVAVDGGAVKYSVAASALHLRSGPNAKSESLDLLRRGTKVSFIRDMKRTDYIDEISASWVKVRTDAAKTGYVFGGYLAPAVTSNIGAVLDKNCDFIHNSFNCARAIERFQSRFDSKYFKRKNNVLEIYLLNGGRVVLKDPPRLPDGDAPEGGSSYSYREYLRPVKHFVVHVQFYEGDAHMLIHAKTGESTDIWDVPLVSPGGRRILTASLDLEAEYNPNGIQVFRLRGEKLVQEWEKRFKGWGPMNAKWLDDRTIRMTKVVLDDGPEYLKKAGKVHIVHGKRGWRIVEHRERKTR